MPHLHTLHPERGFTQISNDALDRLPSLHGAGYLAHLLRHRDGYVPSLDKLVEKKTCVSRRDAQKARAEIIEFGYRVDVRYQHTAGGQFATDVWRSVHPHTAEDVAEIARRYQPGNATQIPQLDEQRQPLRDAHGNVLMRQVTITWADVTSWQGDKQRVQPDGTLPAQDDHLDPVVDVHPAAVGTGVIDTGKTTRGRVFPGHSGLPDPVGRSATSVIPVQSASADVFPGRTEVPGSGGSDTRGVGYRGVYKKTTNNTREEHHPSTTTTSVSDGQTAHAHAADGWVDVNPAREEPENLAQDASVGIKSPSPISDAKTGSIGSHRDTETVGTRGSVLLGKLEKRHLVHLTGQRARHLAAIDAALTVLPEHEVEVVLGDGLDLASSPAGALVTRIRSLAERVAQRRSAQEQHTRQRAQQHQDRNARRASTAATVASPQTRRAAKAYFQQATRPRTARRHHPGSQQPEFTTRGS